MATATFKADEAGGVNFSRAALDAAMQASEHAGLRVLTVDIRIEAATSDESPLAGVVAEALREYLDRPAGRGASSPEESAMAGKFESDLGADVSWRAINRYYDQNGQLVGEVGVNDRGERVDTLLKGLVAPDPIKRAVPFEVGHVAADGSVVIRGLRFPPTLFEVLTNPDPAKRYTLTRSADGTIDAVERP